MTVLFYLTMILFIFVCLFLTLLVLIQKGRGGGLASAFGGAGGNTAFGSKTGDVLTWATSIVFGIFLILGVTLNLLANHQGQSVNAANAAGGAGTVQTSESDAPGSAQVPPADGLPPAAPRDLPEPQPVAPSGPTGVEPGPATPAPAPGPAQQ
jgi:preprotein translocase subunit SecG